MLKLKEVVIENFRSCHKAVFSLEDFTPLVGYNNAGKSNILDAIKWLLRYSVLPESDFCNIDIPIVVIGLISGVDSDVLKNIHDKHRTKITPFCKDDELKIRVTQPKPGCAKTDITLEVFDKDSAEWKKNPAGIPDAIKALFPDPIEIGAMDNITEDVAKHKAGTTIGKLISEVMQPIEQEHGAAINDALEDIRRRLAAEGKDRAAELNEFDRQATEKVQDLFPGIKVKLHVPAPEIRELFKNGTIKVFEDGQELGRDVEALGHGAQRSIQMALIRYLAEIRRGSSETASRTLLLIDEPELYLHPQAIEQVRKALKELSKEGYQVIFSTHSPQMITKEDMPNTLLIRKTSQEGSHARKRLSDAVREVIDETPSQSRSLFELGSLSQILFCDNVLIAEGKTEGALLPDIYECFKEKSIGASKIAFVNPGGSGNIAKCFKILNAMNVPVKGLADLDYAFRQAVKDNFLEKEDEDLEAAKTVFGELAAEHTFMLANDGYPKKGGNLTPAEAFALFADHERGKAYVQSLHDKLIKHNIWLWKKGTIEHHLGINGKGENEWLTFLMNLRTISRGAIKDIEGVSEFIDWIDLF